MSLRSSAVNIQAKRKVVAYADYPTLVIQGAVTFSQAFALSEFGASISIGYNSITGAGYVSRQKYYVLMNGLLNTEGNGTGYLPGSGGTIATGGQYPG
jgi:hypothetical protein